MRIRRFSTAACGCALLALVAPLCADLSFELRETIAGHPALVLKPEDRTARVYITGAKAARVEDGMVRIVDPGLNRITLIDHHGKTFATANMDGNGRDDWRSFNETPGASRVELVEPDKPAQWVGRKVLRDTVRIVLNDELGPSEWLMEIDWLEEIPGYGQSREKLAGGGKRKNAELEAAIQTMAIMNLGGFKDALSVRQRRTSQLAVHILGRFRPRKGSALLSAIGEENEGKALMRIEMEMSNLKAGAVDASVFLVPPGYRKADFETLAGEQERRVRQ